MVVSQFNLLDQLAEGIVHHSFLHFNISIDMQVDVIIGRVRQQVDAVG